MIRVQGIAVGSRARFEQMNRAITAHQIKPIIGKEFAFSDTRAAFQYMESGAHFGKVVINVS
jgi:NADPH:quinone reductase-like Zn-dependent oxidoreductase